MYKLHKDKSEHLPLSMFSSYKQKLKSPHHVKGYYSVVIKKSLKSRITMQTWTGPFFCPFLMTWRDTQSLLCVRNLPEPPLGRPTSALNVGISGKRGHQSEPWTLTCNAFSLTSTNRHKRTHYPKSCVVVVYSVCSISILAVCLFSFADCGHLPVVWITFCLRTTFVVWIP